MLAKTRKKGTVPAASRRPAGPTPTPRRSKAPEQAKDDALPQAAGQDAVSDKQLAADAAKGHQGAFRELLERYERPVFSLVYRMVRDRALAEDLSQEAFVRAFKAIRTYNPSYKFSSWMFKIANNLTIDHLRRKRIETISIHGSPHAVTGDQEAQTRLVVESNAERPDAYVENRELGGQIERAIGALRPEYRTATLLRHVEGYSYDEIAQIMDLPLGTVKTYIHRARLELKEALSGPTGRGG